MNLCALCLHRNSDERFNEDNWNTETVKIGRFFVTTALGGGVRFAVSINSLKIVVLKFSFVILVCLPVCHSILFEKLLNTYLAD